ncbi:transposase [Azospirillum sp. Marseille-Q6669]
MRVRVCGQLSLADDLVRAPENGVLDEIAGAADWAALEVVLRSLRNRRSEAGAPGNPPVLLRCLLLGLWHGGLSDPALEAALADRLSFRRFVGLSLDGPTPDHSTLWRFRAAL